MQSPNTYKVVSAVYLSLLVGTVGCGSSGSSVNALENKLIRQPGDTPEDGKIYVVRDGKRHWILHSSWIGAHSKEFPAGVQMTDASVVGAIPLSDPITAEK